MNQVLSIDLGTSGCRSAVFDQDLNLLYAAKVSYPLMVRSETEIEQDTQVWWDAVKSTIRELADAHGLNAVRAISISSQGISLVPIDKDGNALHNAISWLDTRANAEETVLRQRYGGQALYERTGVILSPLYSLPKLMWMTSHLPDIMERAEKVLLPMDFILLRLCGRAVTEHTMATGTMCYNIHSRGWDVSLLTELGLDAGKLPEILNAGDVAGVILPQTAAELGLSPETVIAVGAQDQKCAAYGAGVSSHTATASIGTCTCITKLIDRLALNESRPPRIPCFSYLKDGQWDLEGIINTTGSALQWFRDKFAPGITFAQLDELAERQPSPSMVKFYPNLAGAGSPYWEKGAGMFAGLTLDSDVGQCARAIMEGVAYNIRANLEEMDRMGNRTAELKLFGGGADSPLWCQIICDVIGRPVAQMQSSDTALAGAAKLAFESVGLPVPPSVRRGQVFQPNPESAARYEETYWDYQRLRQKAFDFV